MRLQEIVGQELAVAAIERAVESARVPHAYLFEGPAGVGKRQAALGLAMVLNCDRAATENPEGARRACGECDPCRRIAGNLHPDVVTIAPITAQIVMEQAQEIVTMVQKRPHEARVRVIIIDDADRLNVSAANALLKTLEEPASRTHIVLVTASPERLLPTIRSRTQRIRFRPVSQASLIMLAKQQKFDVERAQVASILADGRVARFIELLAPKTSDDEGDSVSSGDETRAVVAALRAAVVAKGMVPIFDTASAWGDKESKSLLPDALGILGRIYRDALAIQAGAPELAVFTPETTSEIPLPSNLSMVALGRALGVIVEAELALAGNVNAVMALERLLIHLRRAERGSERLTA